MVFVGVGQDKYRKIWTVILRRKPSDELVDDGPSRLVVVFRRFKMIQVDLDELLRVDNIVVLSPLRQARTQTAFGSLKVMVFSPSIGRMVFRFTLCLAGIRLLMTQFKMARSVAGTHSEPRRRCISLYQRRTTNIHEGSDRT